LPWFLSLVRANLLVNQGKGARPNVKIFRIKIHLTQINFLCKMNRKWLKMLLVVLLFGMSFSACKSSSFSNKKCGCPTDF